MPTFAVANWTSTHSAQFGAQIPTRSPFSSPAASSAAGERVDLRVELGVRRAHALVTGDERLASPKRATVRSRFSPIVSPISGLLATPDA